MDKAEFEFLKVLITQRSKQVRMCLEGISLETLKNYNFMTVLQKWHACYYSVNEGSVDDRVIRPQSLVEKMMLRNFNNTLSICYRTVDQL